MDEIRAVKKETQAGLLESSGDRMVTGRVLVKIRFNPYHTRLACLRPY